MDNIDIQFYNKTDKNLTCAKTKGRIRINVETKKIIFSTREGIYYDIDFDNIWSWKYSIKERQTIICVRTKLTSLDETIIRIYFIGYGEMEQFFRLMSVLESL